MNSNFFRLDFEKIQSVLNAHFEKGYLCAVIRQSDVCYEELTVSFYASKESAAVTLGLGSAVRLLISQHSGVTGDLDAMIRSAPSAINHCKAVADFARCFEVVEEEIKRQLNDFLLANPSFTLSPPWTFGRTHG